MKKRKKTKVKLPKWAMRIKNNKIDPQMMHLMQMMDQDRNDK